MSEFKEEIPTSDVNSAGFIVIGGGLIGFLDGGGGGGGFVIGFRESKVADLRESNIADFRGSSVADFRESRVADFRKSTVADLRESTEAWESVDTLESFTERKTMSELPKINFHIYFLFFL